MAKRRSPWWSRIAQAAALSAAIGTAKPTQAAPTEQDQASRFNYSLSVAKNQARQASQNPNEADRLEVEGIKARVAELDGDFNPSLSVQQDAQGNINTVFNVEGVPLGGGNDRHISTSKKFSSSKPDERNTAESPAELAPDSMPAVAESMPDENNLLKNDTEPFSSTTEQNPAETNVSSAELAEADAEADNDIENITNEATRMEQGLKDAMHVEQQNQAQADAQQKQKKLQTQQNIEAGRRTQAQNVQQQAAQQQASANPLLQELAKATQTLQRLGRKLARLKTEKMALTFALYSAKALKAIIDVIQAGVQWLAGVCMSLAWTIILGIIGVILYLVYGLLWIPKGTLWSTIKLIQAKIDSIKKNMKETEKTQQNAVAVVKSIRRKLNGRQKKQQRYPMPQGA